MERKKYIIIIYKKIDTAIHLQAVSDFLLRYCASPASVVRRSRDLSHFSLGMKPEIFDIQARLGIWDFNVEHEIFLFKLIKPFCFFSFLCFSAFFFLLFLFCFIQIYIFCVSFCFVSCYTSTYYTHPYFIKKIEWFFKI